MMDWNIDPRKQPDQATASPAPQGPTDYQTTVARAQPTGGTTGGNPGAAPMPGAPPPPGAPPGATPGGPVRIPYGRSMPSFPSPGTGYPVYGGGGYPGYGPRGPRAGYAGATNYPQPGNTYPVAGGQGERPGAWTPPWGGGGASAGYMPSWRGGGGGGFMLNNVNPQQGYAALQQRMY